MPNGYNYTEVYKNGKLDHFAFASSRDGIRYFNDHYGADLIAALSGTGIFYQVALAQKCWESSYGTSILAREARNFGGIKWTPRTSASIGRFDLGPSTWCLFSSPQHCFSYYTQTLLSPSKKYVKSGLLTANTPLEQLRAIATGGYCTVPPGDAYYNSISKLVNLVSQLYNTSRIK